MELIPTLQATYRYKHTRRAQPHSLQITSVTPKAVPYVGHVRDKFPEAPSEILNRLGEANWQRHERLRAGPMKRETATAADMQAVKSLPPKSLFQPQSLFFDSALGSSLRTTSERECSVASHSSFASSADENTKGRLRVPPMPTTTWGESFTCPFCSKSVTCVSRIEWK